jgi:hypothetical protein
VGRIAVAVLVTTAALLAAASGGASDQREARIGFFRMPSNNIACGYFPRSGRQQTTLRCDILSGLRPEPRRACQGDWTGASMRLTGRAAATCAGDTVYDPRARILSYGSSWKRAGLVCVSRRTGLTCTNRSRHGFFLSRERWRVF